MAVGRGVTRAEGIDRAEAVGATFDRGRRDYRDVRRIGCEFGNHRNIDHRFDGGGDVPHQVRVLAHRHAVALGVRAGQVQLEAVRDRRENFRHRHELLDTAAENRGQQETVRGYFQGRQHLPRCLCARVGQPDRIDEAARRVLAVHRFAIARARLQADALGGDHAHLRHMVEHILDDGCRGGDDAGGNRERARQGFTEEFHSQDRGLARRWGERVNSRASIRVWRGDDHLLSTPR